jgi:ribonuclease G
VRAASACDIVGNNTRQGGEVLPNLAAFINIGLERAAFIHAAEISSREGSNREISALVHEGQSLVVQVTKDPIGSKGAFA